MPGLIVEQERLSVAIVGGGIIGLTLALGLLKRNIDVVVYEQARSLREIGAGVAFTANAVRCMRLIHPGIVEALRSVATANGDPNNETDYLRWVDGFNDQGDGEEEPLFMLDAGYKGFEGCHRAHFLDALIKHIPDGVVQLNKRLETLDDNVNSSKVRLDFADGSSALADTGEFLTPPPLPLGRRLT
jgi:salicylate hydroxylase